MLQIHLLYEIQLSAHHFWRLTMPLLLVFDVGGGGSMEQYFISYRSCYDEDDFVSNITGSFVSCM